MPLSTPVPLFVIGDEPPAVFDGRTVLWYFRRVPDSNTPRADLPIEEMPFEDAIARLEAIIERVERGQVGVERAMAEYEQGVKLVARCRAVLARVEQRIEELAPEHPGASG